MHWIRHYVKDIVGGVQKCTLCGKIICDYRNAMVMQNEDGSIPKAVGWAEGFIFQRGKNPEVTITSIYGTESFDPCNKNQLN